MMFNFEMYQPLIQYTNGALTNMRKECKRPELTTQYLCAEDIVHDLFLLDEEVTANNRKQLITTAIQNELASAVRTKCTERQFYSSYVCKTCEQDLPASAFYVYEKIKLGLYVKYVSHICSMCISDRGLDTRTKYSEEKKTEIRKGRHAYYENTKARQTAEYKKLKRQWMTHLQKLNRRSKGVGPRKAYNWEALDPKIIELRNKKVPAINIRKELNITHQVFYDRLRHLGLIKPQTDILLLTEAEQLSRKNST